MKILILMVVLLASNQLDAERIGKNTAWSFSDGTEVTYKNIPINKQVIEVSGSSLFELLNGELISSAIMSKDKTELHLHLVKSIGRPGVKMKLVEYSRVISIFRKEQVTSIVEIYSKEINEVSEWKIHELIDPKKFRDTELHSGAVPSVVSKTTVDKATGVSTSKYRKAVINGKTGALKITSLDLPLNKFKFPELPD